VDSRTQRRHDAIGALRPAVVLCIREHPNQGVTTRLCKIFERGSPVGAILWLVGGEVASLAMEKKGEGEERSSLLFGLPCFQCRARSGLEDSVLFCFDIPLSRI
jgi:hypothetical protein